MTPRYADLTLESGSPLKRFSHRARFAMAVDLLAPRAGDRVLDYGTCDGAFLRWLRARCPEAVLAGFEPDPAYLAEARRSLADVTGSPELTDRAESLAAFRPTAIACLEVLEHLRVADQEHALATMKALLAPGGRVLISVPIEIGPASLFKNLARVALGQAHPNTDVGTVLRAALGLTRGITRGADEAYIQSHVGFDHRALPARFRAAGFHVRRRAVSPFPRLGMWCNSQLFYLLDGA